MSVNYSKINSIISKFIDLDKYSIFVFGSYARGEERSSSDIDIGILGKQEVELTKMYLIRDALNYSDIQQKVDIIDFKSKFLSEEFKEYVLNSDKKILLSDLI